MAARNSLLRRNTQVDIFEKQACTAFRMLPDPIGLPLQTYWIHLDFLLHFKAL